MPRQRLTFHGLGGRDDDLVDKGLEGWARESSAAFDLDLFSGGYFFIRDHQAKLLAVIARDLDGRRTGATVPGPTDAR